MAALLDLHPEPIHPVLAGTKEIEAVLDQLLPGPDTVSGTVPDIVLGTHDYTAAVTALERVSRRLDAMKLKLVAAADTACATSTTNGSTTPPTTTSPCPTAASDSADVREDHPHA